MRARRLTILAASLALAACTPVRDRAASDRPASDEPVRDEPAPQAGPRIRFEPAPSGDVVAAVRAFVVAARAEGRTPLVYVGASWCEPCQYFHAAAEGGDLDSELPRIALLEFDRDRDGARLDAAGYSSRMIPLFVVPRDDGQPSEQRIEGSIHGPGSPAQIAPRLRAILP